MSKFRQRCRSWEVGRPVGMGGGWMDNEGWSNPTEQGIVTIFIKSS